MRQIYSTAEIAECDRLAHWVDTVCCTFIHVDCEPRRDRPFFGEIKISSAGEVRVGTVRSTAQLITRSAQQIARDPADVFNLGLQNYGQALMRQGDREVLLRPGDFALHDSTRPWQLAFDGDFFQTVLQLPRAALLRRLGPSEDLVALRVDGTTGLGGMLSQMLRELPRWLDAVPASACARLGENLLDLIATALLAQGERVPPPSAQMTLSRAKLWIEMHLAEDLSAEHIASKCGVSSRHLSRLFERQETSLMRYVWQRRLACCHRSLTDPAMLGYSITELAFAAGFNDLSHFSRAYKAHYGRSPRDVRRESMHRHSHLHE
jgi:AraC-like DNA-binding protein